MVRVQSNGEQALMPQNMFGQPLTIFGLPVDKERIFSNIRGQYKAAIEKRQRRLIAKTTHVKFFLNHNEQIRCITTGYSPVSILEQFLTGPSFLYFKRAFFIFTDKRILHVPARISHSSQSAISQILYEDCAQIRIKGHTLMAQYKNGDREAFPYICRKERKRIKSLLKGLSLKPKEADRVHGRSYLCPSCTRMLPEKATACSGCQLAFKSGIKAKIRALLIPGGGYFYTRYPVLGFAVGIIECTLLASLVFQWSNYRNGIPGSLTLIFPLAGILIFEKAVAMYHTKELTRDFIPEEKEFATRKA